MAIYIVLAALVTLAIILALGKEEVPVKKVIKYKCNKCSSEGTSFDEGRACARWIPGMCSGTITKVEE